jgi:HK97 family phage portal protein
MPDNRKKIGKTKQILAAIFRIPLESDASDAIAKVILSQTQAGQTVDKETVLKLSAVWACTRLISETISTLPLKVYERDGELRRAAYNVPQYRLLHDSPNAYSTSQTWLQANVASMLFHGNAWNHIRRTGSLITSIEFINPNALVGVNRDSNRNIVSIVYRNNNEDITVRMADLLHIPAFTTDGKTGLSAIQHGAAVFGSALAASDSANNHFKNGLMPTTAFLYDKSIDESKRVAFREYVNDIAGALNAGQSPLLEGGMTVESIGVPPKDSQLLESRLFSVEEVCRWFRVDPSLVGHGGKDSNFGTGIEQKMLGFLIFTLRPLLTTIEQRLNKILFNPSEQTRYFCEFSVEGLLRADTKARAEFYKILVDIGVMTRDEVRLKENLSPMGGNANILTVNAATIGLNGVNNEQTQTTESAA